MKISIRYQILALLLVGVGFPLPGMAQDDPDLANAGGAFEDGAEEAAQIISNYAVDREVFGGGNFYWAMAEIETSEIIARGKMDVEGIDRIILAPNTAYRMLTFYEETLSLGTIDFTTPRAGRTFQIPCMDYILLEDPPDQDGDGLPDALELIAGTNEQNPDTDGDGFPDGAEVRRGDDPLDGFFAATGIIASGPTPAPALDVCTINNVAVVACGNAGVAVFNVSQGNAPTRIAQVDTPGNAISVACFGSYIAVADRQGGLAVVDISDPPASRILHQLQFNSPVNCVTARGNFAFAGLDNGRVVMVDMITGTEIGRRAVTGTRIQDLVERGGYLYALIPGRLYTMEILDGELAVLGNDSSPGSVGAGQVRLRLIIGDDYLYATHTSGFNVFDLGSLGDPVLTSQNLTAARGWKHIVPNGTGLGVAAVSPNSTADGRHDVSVYRTTGEWGEESFVTTYETPGRANAVSLYNGLAYVADGDAGLQVLNFLAFDTAGQPPSISITAQTSNGNVEEGKVFTVQTPVDDDVMVRSVEYFINDVAVALDGNFPFELGLISPAIEGENNQFQIRAVATDTGGNITESETLTIGLVPDATPPRVRAVNPGNGEIIGKITSVLGVFSEPVVASGVQGFVTLTRGGPDGNLGTADDERVAIRREYSPDTNTVSVIFAGDAQPGIYQFKVDRRLTDLAGNPFQEDFISVFRIYGFEDADKDGVPDDLEESLNLDPLNPDTDGDGIRDGLEDFDGDDLVNVGEVILNRNPTEPDTDGNGINDGDEDVDLDGLTDGEEILVGTDPGKVDTDGDGVSDKSEVEENTNPLDASSITPTVVSSGLASFLNGLSVNPNSSEGIPYAVTSATVSFLNGFVEPAGDEFEFAVASAPASYLNGFVEPPGDQFELAVSSSPASYLNAVTVESPVPFWQTSPVVSYENDAP